MLEPADQNARMSRFSRLGLLDLFGRGTPWHRTLWNPGLILSLRELLEPSEERGRHQTDSPPKGVERLQVDLPSDP